MLYMCSAQRGDDGPAGRGDLTAKAAIRDQALRLFAAHGPDAISLRQVAAAAGVSPGLIVHHFQSKAGLQEAVNMHVAGLFDELFATMDDADWSTAGGASFAEAIVSRLPPSSPIPAYLRRLLLDGHPAGRALLARWHAMSRQVVDQLTAAGMVRAGPDPATLAAFLMVNDLALIMLRDQLHALLDVDPLSHDGMVQWADVALTVYRDGLFARPGELPAFDRPTTGLGSPSTSEEEN